MHNFPPMQAKSLVDSPKVKKQSLIEEYENAFIIRLSEPFVSRNKRNIQPRGKITAFSRKSRNRLLHLFGRLQYSLLRNSFFITLTYHHREEAKRQSHKDDLNLWLQHLRIKAPDALYIWRCELQKRGMPHYHVIVFNLPADDRRSEERIISHMRSAWHRIADPSSSHHTNYGFKCDPLSSFRHAFTYLSKYCAKVDSNVGGESIGRVWGRSNTLPLSPVDVIPISTADFFILRRMVRKLLKSRNCKNKAFIRRLRNQTTIYIFGRPGTVFFPTTEGNICIFDMLVNSLLPAP